MAQSADRNNTTLPSSYKSKFPSWTFDPVKNEYYYYSLVEKAWIYQSGKRVYTNSGDLLGEKSLDSPRDEKRAPMLSWTLDPATNEHYYYSQTEKAYVYQNGRRVYTNLGDLDEQEVVELPHDEETISVPNGDVIDSCTVEDTTCLIQPREIKIHDETFELRSG
jgi:hypothetical protein